MSEKDLVRRYRDKTDSYYNLSMTLTEESAVEFNEGYYYPARGDDEGGEYDYYLTIEAPHFDAFVSLLIRRCQMKERVPQTSKELLLRELLDQLVVQGELGNSDTIKASLDTLKSWLDQERIPYKQSFMYWSSG